MDAKEFLTRPDSTTKERFVLDEDVLIQFKDGKFYLGTVVELDLAQEKCLVKFLDDTAAWWFFHDIQKLSSNESETTCVHCKCSDIRNGNEVVACNKCGRSYHQYCHKPNISDLDKIPGSGWRCKRCFDYNKVKPYNKEPKKTMIKFNIRQVCSGRDKPQPPPDNVAKLPYDIDLLSWDSHHRVNAEQIYCYCGLNGEWYTQMLQCARCKQWFHEKCLSCLNYPLFSGDRFYVFVCAMCNHGKEFVRRMELKWLDLVHLMLYNLTVFNAVKYYDLDTVILPYAENNWHQLQLPPHIRDVSPAVRKERIMEVLSSPRHNSRFKCGKEIKKKTCLWGLRDRLPPPSPVVPVPPSGVMDDVVLGELLVANNKLEIRFLYENVEPPSEILPTACLQQNSAAFSESLDSKVDLINTIDIIDVKVPLNETNASPIKTSTCNESPISNEDRNRYIGGGFVKKSVPFPRIKSRMKRRSKNVKNLNPKLLRKQMKRIQSLAVNKEKSQEAKYLKARQLLKNAIAKSKLRKDALGSSDLPPTPPTSVSSPPTPPATSSSSSSGMSELSAPSTMDLKNRLLPLSTPVVTSGDEEEDQEVARCTREPTPDPFVLAQRLPAKQGAFSEILEGSSWHKPPDEDRPLSPSLTPLTVERFSITLPLSLNPVVPQPPRARPVKRQLSEKDIIIDEFGRVRKRRQRRRTVPFQHQPHQPASKNAAILPRRSTELHLNGRKLRQRRLSSEKLLLAAEPEVMDLPKKRHSMPQNRMSDNDLRSSVNVYFSAANRIAAGESFVVKAKRSGPGGQTQYLIEWESVLS